jgi:hypothetical protein
MPDDYPNLSRKRHKPASRAQSVMDRGTAANTGAIEATTGWATWLGNLRYGLLFISCSPAGSLVPCLYYTNANVAPHVAGGPGRCG